MMSLNPAKTIRMDNEVGSIEIGKNADFTVLDKNLEVYMMIKNEKVGYKK